MIVDAGPRYELLKRALEKGYAKSKNQHYEITVEQDKEGNLESVVFDFDGQAITAYYLKNGYIEDFGAYTGYYTHLDHTKVVNVLKNSLAIEQAVKDKLIDGPKPIRVFESSTSKMALKGWTVIEEPTKVKHKKANDGKPIIAIPVKRDDVSRSDIDTDSWVIYAFKPVPTPDDPKRSGGYGRGNKDPGS